MKFIVATYGPSCVNIYTKNKYQVAWNCSTAGYTNIDNNFYSLTLANELKILDMSLTI